VPTPIPTPAPASCGGILSLGMPVAGQLISPTQKCVYTYSATRDETVKITLVKTSGNLDTYLELYDSHYPSSPRLDYSDDNSEVVGRDSQIDSYTFDATGPYKIVVSSYAGRSSGPYRLTVAQP
jgi:hypothetical protein